MSGSLVYRGLFLPFFVSAAGSAALSAGWGSAGAGSAAGGVTEATVPAVAGVDFGATLATGAAGAAGGVTVSGVGVPDLAAVGSGAGGVGAGAGGGACFGIALG